MSDKVTQLNVFNRPSVSGGNSATHGNQFSAFNTPASPILFPVAEREVFWKTRSGEHVATKDYKALVRVMDDRTSPHLLNVVSQSYKLVHNRELFEIVEQAIIAHVHARLLAEVQVTDRMSDFGRTCYREYKFPNFKCDVGAKSHIGFRMIVQNGYGGSALRIHAGAIEFYCTNGMISGNYQSTYRRHTAGLVIDGLDSAVVRAVKQFHHSKDEWSRWTATPVKHEAAMDLLRSIASSPRMFDNLSNHYLNEREVRGENVWTVYSTLTYYSSHNDGDFALRNPANPNAADIMLRRELNVAKWINTPQFRALVT